MIALSNIDLYNLLKLKVGDDEAKAITDYIDIQVKDRYDAGKQYLATKEDVSRIEVKIAESKTDSIKWTFSFFMALALMIIGLYFKK